MIRRFAARALRPRAIARGVDGSFWLWFDGKLFRDECVVWMDPEATVGGFDAEGTTLAVVMSTEVRLMTLDGCGVPRERERFSLSPLRRLRDDAAR